MAKETLKPCPFCGGQAMLCKQVVIYGAPVYSVCCIKCPVEVSFQSNPVANVETDDSRAVKRMVDAWNRRGLNER